MREADKRGLSRVEFSKAISVQLLAIDGTWNRKCEMRDVAGDGARLFLETSIQGLNLKEFFLLLSSTGSSFRRCELAWINGNEIGIRFIHKKNKPPKTRSENFEI